MTITPMAGRLFLEYVEPAETRGTIVLPDTVDRRERNGGKIVAVADYRIDHGKRSPMYLQGREGQYAIFQPRQADVFRIKDRLFYAVHEDYVLAIFPTLEDFQHITHLAA